MRNRIITPTAILLLSTIVSMAHAQRSFQWRCGNLFVRKGVMLAEVLHHCGEPVFRRTDGTVNRKKAETLIYGPASGFHYILSFEGGELKNVDRRRVR